jgi:DNA-binding FadR family transcriptional regulator
MNTTEQSKAEAIEQARAFLETIVDTAIAKNFTDAQLKTLRARNALVLAAMEQHMPAWVCATPNVEACIATYVGKVDRDAWKAA